MRLESQLSRMNCQTFSTGLSSGHFGGSRMMVMLAGTRRRVDKCQPAWSTRRMAWAAGATVAAISARCKFIASVLQAGMIRAAPLPSFGHCTEDVGGSGPLVPRCAWTGAALGPAAGGLVLLVDAGLVGEPEFYRVAGKPPLARHCLHARGGGRSGEHTAELHAPCNLLCPLL